MGLCTYYLNECLVAFFSGETIAIMDVSFPTQKAKCLKLGLCQSSCEGKSRICSLPDSILKHILSFLPIEEAVKTSVLSKRWEFLWASHSKLKFHEFITDSDDDSDDETDDEDITLEEATLRREKTRENFLNFVAKTLLLHDSSNIHTFSLKCKVEAPSNGTQPRINSWIHAALRHKVQKLILKLSFSDSHGSFVLPRHLFDCESLNELELDFLCDLRLPSFVYFPNLKILSLSKVIFMDYNSVKQLFSSFPKLEKLDLIECKWDNVKAVYVSAPMLEHLKIVEDGYRRRNIEEPDCCQFMISGPKLKIFHYRGELINEYCIVEVPSLVSALIGMYSSNSRAEKRVGYRAHKLLGGVSNVKNLQVSLLTLEVCSKPLCNSFYHQSLHCLVCHIIYIDWLSFLVFCI